MSRTDDHSWPLQTLLVCMRNARQEDNWGGTKGKRALAAQAEATPPPHHPQPTLQTAEALYPFTKGFELTNEGLAYGEQTTLQLRLPNGTVVTRCARRTRTGSVRLGLEVPTRQTGARRVEDQYTPSQQSTGPDAGQRDGGDGR